MKEIVLKFAPKWFDCRFVYISESETHYLGIAKADEGIAPAVVALSKDRYCLEYDERETNP